MQQFRSPAQKGHDLGPQIARTHGPARPVVDVWLEHHVDKAVRQRAGHAGGDGAVALAIAGGEYSPAVWQAVFAQGAIEHQLIAGGLDERRRGVEFVEEQDAGAVLRQELRDGPGRPALLDRWQPTQIDWIKQNGADIDQADAQRRRDLRNDLGFADARRSQRKAGLWICASNCSEDAISDGFMGGVLHDGPPWSLSPSTSPVTDLPPALSLFAAPARSDLTG